MDEKILKENLVKLRKAQGLTQNDVANSLGISVLTVHRWESLKFHNTPKAGQLPQLAKLLGVSVETLCESSHDSVNHPFDLRHNQADHLRKGECAGVCPGAQGPEEQQHPTHDSDDPLRLTTIKTGRVLVLKVYRYSEVMTQGSDKVEPCAVEYVRASEFAECTPEKLRVIEQDIPYRLSVTADISSSGAETIVVNDDFDFVSGNIYLVSMSGLEMFYRVSSCPDGSYLLADDTGIKSLSPPAQAETGFRFVAVAERTIIRGGKLLRRK